jgi:glutathione peroxidase-family protein
LVYFVQSEPYRDESCRVFVRFHCATSLNTQWVTSTNFKGQSYDGKGIEWAFRNYLNGKDGKILKTKKNEQGRVETHSRCQMILKTV